MLAPKIAAVALELTGVCNQKCAYCYNEWRSDGGKSISHGQDDRIVARVRRLLETFDIGYVTLTGGEPLASPVVFDVLDELSRAGVPAQMISNGGLVTSEIAARLAPYRLRFVQVTLNGATQALHEEHVGPGHFEKTLRGVRTLMQHGVPVVGCTVVTKRNAGDIGNILTRWRAMGVESVALSRFSPAGYASSQVAALLPSHDDLIRAFELAAPFGRSGMTLKCTMPVPPCAFEVERFPEIIFGTCPVGTSAQEFALSPDGRLRNCTLHQAAIGGVSDILDAGDLAQLVRAPEVTEYRRQVPEFCRGCLHEHTCGGGCGAASEWVLGGAQRLPDPFVWQHVDDAFAARLTQPDASGRLHLSTIS